MSEPKLVAIDCALDDTGLVTVDGQPLLSKGKTGDARLRRLYDDVFRIAGKADLAIMEDLPVGAQGAGHTGRAHGAARMALADHGVPVVLVVASTLKKYATGNGRADKPAMVKAANEFMYGQGFTWGPITDHNEADAFCLFHLGRSWLRAGGRARDANVKWQPWARKLKDLGWPWEGKPW